MLQKASALFLALAVLMLNAAPAIACSCVSYANAREHVSRTDVIFIGVVERSHRVGEFRLRTTFRVSEVLKGQVGSEAIVHHGDDTCCICGIVYEPGARVMVFAHQGDDGRLNTSSCAAPRFPEAEYRAAL